MDYASDTNTSLQFFCDQALIYSGLSLVFNTNGAGTIAASP